MNFDYRFGTEATFHDWVNEGIAKAKAILDCTDTKKEPENNTDSEQDKFIGK